jgi:hypothetical protein
MRRAFLVNSDKCISAAVAARWPAKASTSWNLNVSGAMSIRWIEKFIHMKNALLLAGM